MKKKRERKRLVVGVKHFCSSCLNKSPYTTYCKEGRIQNKTKKKCKEQY